MKIIKVNQINFTEKDIVEVSNLKDLEEINKQIFSDGFVFDLNDVYYLIGADVVYLFKKRREKT